MTIFHVSCPLPRRQPPVILVCNCACVNGGHCLSHVVKLYGLYCTLWRWSIGEVGQWGWSVRMWSSGEVGQSSGEVGGEVGQWGCGRVGRLVSEDVVEWGGWSVRMWSSGEGCGHVRRYIDVWRGGRVGSISMHVWKWSFKLGGEWGGGQVWGGVWGDGQVEEGCEGFFKCGFNWFIVVCNFGLACCSAICSQLLTLLLYCYWWIAQSCPVCKYMGRGGSK